MFTSRMREAAQQPTSRGINVGLVVVVVVPVVLGDVCKAGTLLAQWSVSARRQVAGAVKSTDIGVAWHSPAG